MFLRLEWLKTLKKWHLCNNGPNHRVLSSSGDSWGSTGYYMRFFKHYGLRLVTNLLKKDNFNWGPVAEQAFERLKLAMTQAPVQGLPNFKKSF